MSEQDDLDQFRHQYDLVTPFWIDTPAYTSRERSMFVCGYEFCLVVSELESGEAVSRTIHRENSSRIRMLLGKRKRVGTVENCQKELDPDGTWAYLEVSPSESTP